MTQEPSAILVVDDEKEMRQLLRDTLEEEQYRVVVASDGPLFKNKFRNTEGWYKGL